MHDTWRVKAKQSNIIHPSLPETVAQYFRTEMTRYMALAKKAGISLN